MDKAQISKTQIGIIAAVVAVIAAIAVFVVMRFTRSEDAYRSIQIYEVEGTASVDREGIGTMEAVENLYLESGDRITVSSGSYMRLKLDDDKYILVEEKSVLSIEAEGTKQDSLTTIRLEQGAVTNEIRNPLSEKSTYEVITPNSVMAVRGTVFRVAISIDENGILYTKVDTFEGAVGVRRILPDGSIQEEDAHIPGGNEVIVYMDEQITEYLSAPQEIRYEELPVQTLSFLKDSSDSGREIVGVSRESLETLITEKKEQEAAELEAIADGSAPEDVAENGTSENAELTPEEEILEPSGEENQTAGQTLDQNAMQGAEEAAQAIDQIQQPVDPEEQAVVEEEQVTTQVTEPAKSGSSSSSDDESNTSSGEHTVKFMCGGKLFGTQTVKHGEKVKTPILQPAESGSWEKEKINQAITEDDIEINWES